MMSKQLLKYLNKSGVKYTFKLPWKLVEDNMSFVISDTQSTIEHMFSDDTMRLPFGPCVLHCFYPDTSLKMKLNGKYTPPPQAVCVIQSSDSDFIVISVIDETGNTIKHNGYSITSWLRYIDGKVSLPFYKRLPFSEDDELITDQSELSDKILAQFDIAFTVFAASMYALYYRETKTITRKLSLKRSARQRINMPTDYLIPICRKKYIYTNNIKQPTLEFNKKRPHSRKGHWCHSRKVPGKRWWKNPCKIHGGSDVQNYKI